MTSLMYAAMMGLNSSWNQGTVEGVMEEVRMERSMKVRTPRSEARPARMCHMAVTTRAASAADQTEVEEGLGVAPGGQEAADEEP